MNTAILDPEPIVHINSSTLHDNVLVDDTGVLIGADEPTGKRFGLADLWNVRKRRRHFSIYRN